MPEDDATAVAADLRKELDVTAGARDGVATHFVGQGALWAAMQDLSKEDLAKAESAGFPVVLLILLAVFGTLAAASLPLLLGLVSVLVTGGLIFALSQVMEMSVFVTNMASMIGIGVAVDYSLFVVARYREEVAAGRSHEEARSVAMATSGLAVLFSGLTVIVSLAGLWMVDNQAIRSMALGAMLVVAVAMLGAATLLPLLLGRRVARPGRFARRRAPEPGGSAFWKGWTAAVMRRPVLAVVSTSAILHRARAARARHADRHGRARPVPVRPRGAPGLRGRRGASPGRGPRRRSRSSRSPAASGEAVRDAIARRPGRGRRRRARRLARRRAPCSSRPSRATARETDAAKATVERLRAELPAAARAGTWTSAACPRRRSTSPTW